MLNFEKAKDTKLDFEKAKEYECHKHYCEHNKPNIFQVSNTLCLCRTYSRKQGHACDFSEKGQKRAKYLKIWA